jgi:hypothetical protein
MQKCLKVRPSSKSTKRDSEVGAVSTSKSNLKETLRDRIVQIQPVDPGARRNDSEEDQDGIHGKMFELYLTTITPIVEIRNRSGFMKRTASASDTVSHHH